MMNILLFHELETFEIITKLELNFSVNRTVTLQQLQN